MMRTDRIMNESTRGKNHLRNFLDKCMEADLDDLNMLSRGTMIVLVTVLLRGGATSKKV